MKKEELLKLGLDEEMAKKVESASAEELKGFIPKLRFDEVNTEKNALQTAVKERDTQLETLKKSTGDVDTMKQQIAELQTANITKDKDHAAAIKTLQLNNAVDKALAMAKAKNSTATKALLASFLEKAELAEDGSVKGLDDEIKKMTDNKDTSFLFDVAAKSEPGISGAAPAGTVTATPDPKMQGYQTRLAEARKNGDTITAIKIKQEAAAEGVTNLM